MVDELESSSSEEEFDFGPYAAIRRHNRVRIQARVGPFEFVMNGQRPVNPPPLVRHNAMPLARIVSCLWEQTCLPPSIFGPLRAERLSSLQRWATAEAGASTCGPLSRHADIIHSMRVLPATVFGASCGSGFLWSSASRWVCHECPHRNGRSQRRAVQMSSLPTMIPFFLLYPRTQ